MSINISEEKPRIAEFLNKNRVGVLATTSSDGYPHAATMYFTVDEDLNIYFVTKEKTTKYRNLTQNPNAAFVVHEPMSQSTVQVSGTVAEVTDIAQLNQVFRNILEVTAGTSESNVPPVSKIVGGDYKCFKLTPKTLRLAEYTKPEHGQFDNMFDTETIPSAEL